MVSLWQDAVQGGPQIRAGELDGGGWDGAVWWERGTVTGCCADKLQDESIASLVERPWVLPASPAACSPLTRPACLACLPGLPAWPACRYDLANARDQYRFACGPDGGNKRLLLRYLEVGCGCTAMGRGGAVLGGAGLGWAVAFLLYICLRVCLPGRGPQ